MKNKKLLTKSSKRRLKFQNYLVFKIVANNIFYNLNTLYFKKKTPSIGHYKVGKSLYATNTGRLNLKISKRSIKHNLNSFFNKINYECRLKKLKKKNVIASITAPKRLKRRVFFFFQNTYKQRAKVFLFNHKKSFNGCRPPKTIRKKRKILRLF